MVALGSALATPLGDAGVIKQVLITWFDGAFPVQEHEGWKKIIIVQ